VTVSDLEDIKRHTRVNQMLLGPLERPALQFLARTAPPWVTPDVLTAIGVAGSLLCFVGYWLTQRDAAWLWVVNLGLIINWYGDSLDGTLARFRKIERPKFGFYIDHTVDAVAEFLTIIGIGLSPYLRLDVAAFALIGYLLMSVHVYVRTCVDGVFKISYGAIGPTELRIIVFLVNATVFFAEDWFLAPVVRDAGVLGTLRPFDIVGLVLAVALSLVFLVASAQHAVRLARAGE
jgi:phosphatidylglycerophosphate synthase